MEKFYSMYLSQHNLTKIGIQFCFVLFLFATFACNNNNGQEVKTDTHADKKGVGVKQKWHWGNHQMQNEDVGYAQVVKVGNMLYISGIPTEELNPKGIDQVYRALGKCLSANGASFADVVKETLYTTDIETMKKYNDVRKEFYKGDFPAATWVQISRLYEPNCKLEVELIAQIGNDK
ncbi:Enamine deaminase RidA, house cleaning of reactive enamine intermediates, YjgF/YER057c/UK114 family [Filimonas lacunae]|uniref:Enamine deaminase RidA, house cleaning of reactive enamine intermediates, YjgF/YER057c/UK114 family n=1 Tax=Filimonas lacunae TaxID=477680 RepID=A0A1N7QVY8_9BACT|nr:RidA family protein [Filimonas lacunae]SIT26979.1 Enamine deaminase RidA, house cleaning of reactive enamine intermediates, YjgF/YER057c/UK114 family [Filimonas lacunae]